MFYSRPIGLLSAVMKMTIVTAAAVVVGRVV